MESINAMLSYCSSFEKSCEQVTGPEKLNFNHASSWVMLGWFSLSQSSLPCSAVVENSRKKINATEANMSSWKKGGICAWKV